MERDGRAAAKPCRQRAGGRRPRCCHAVNACRTDVQRL